MLSIVINVDTRQERQEQTGMFSGVVDRDFLDEGIHNKKKFFEGFDFETIVFLDLHEDIDEKQWDYLRKEVDTLVIRKHNKKFQDQTEYPAFNDLNYLNALSMARGDYIFHFDGDCAAFTSSPEPIESILNLLEVYDYVSYPSHWSPNPVVDESFAGNYWVSTRFFACKRETLDFTEIMKCQLDYDYWRTKYPRTRLCHWTEHILQSISKNGVYYPPIEADKYLIFVWETYEKWTLRRLNDLPYEDVLKWVTSRGGLIYPNNVKG